MLKINRGEKTLVSLNRPGFANIAINERRDLQEYIWNSPNEFFREIGQELFLVAKEFQPSDDVGDRIDLLAIDKEGKSVIIELKRGNNKYQLFQAISYAGMISKWKPDDFRGLDGADFDKLESFLEVEIEEINQSQRILLIAEAFDFSLLAATEWLNEQYGVDISCCRLSVAKDDDAGGEYLACSNVYPAPELAQQAIRVRRSGISKPGPKWSNWEAAIAQILNPDEVAFYQSRLKNGQEFNLNKRTLVYRIGDKRRFSLYGRKKLAYAWQRGRFEGDLEHWKSGLSSPELVKPVKRNRCLSFTLVTSSDFTFFQETFEKLLDFNTLGDGEKKRFAD